ncbi:YceI family protein [Spongiimicrobium salis]|uniref:YceI family protein n=1 Tax=Spongiimicrobium salis TaxID=1667022 RepID=UPI00374CA919
MTRNIKITMVVILFSTLAFTQTKAYPIDGWHSKIGFSVNFSGLLPIKGQFDKIDGTILLDEANMANTSATINIQANSINTGVEIRDKHLRGKDFFDAANYPTIRFSSEKMIQKKGQWVMVGNLKVRRTSKTVEIPMKLLHGEKLDAWKNYRITLKGGFTLNRLDFQVGEDQIGIGDEVAVTFTISARIFNTATVALFDCPFGKKMIAAIQDGNKEKARTQFEELLRLDDSDAKKATSFEFLYLYLKQNNYDNASYGLAELYLDLFPEDSNAHSLLGNAYFEKNAFSEAKDSFKQALYYDHQNTFAKEMLKRTLKVLKKREE